MTTKDHGLIDQRIIDLTLRDFLNALKAEGWSKPAVLDSSSALTTRKVQVKQLAEIYGWGESTIYKWCNARTIPHSRVEHEIWFDLDKIEKWIEKNEIKTKDEVVANWEAKKITATKKTAKS